MEPLEWTTEMSTSEKALHDTGDGHMVTPYYGRQRLNQANILKT